MKLEEHNNWEEALRKMLPAGAPLPDEEQLDYSIALEYEGPPVAYDVPKVEPLNVDCVSICSSSIVSVSDSSSIPVVAPIVAATRFSRFNRTTNGGFGMESRSTPDCHRSSSVSRSQSEAQNWEHEDSCFRDGRGDELLSSVSSLRSQTSVRKPAVEGRRLAVVTFNTRVDSDKDEEDGFSSPRSSATDLAASPVVSRRTNKEMTKRRACSRCGKGNRLREKEACIVCDARYCANCILKVMGSMPEGRKCVSCIGQPIDESKRSNLGKCSKILSSVCSPLEIKQIMKAEKECAANQLRPEQLIVNGRQLRQEELDEVLGCSIPPQKLKPGKYWYDKDSGLWGKEGEKPDRIISSKLNVGGKLRESASNGNTKVFINGREITKIELKVLKLASVQCPKDTHFWLYDDGSYEEEGQNNIKGNIWGKAGVNSFLLFIIFIACTTWKSSWNKRRANY